MPLRRPDTSEPVTQALLLVLLVAVVGLVAVAVGLYAAP